MGATRQGDQLYELYWEGCFNVRSFGSGYWRMERRDGAVLAVPGDDNFTVTPMAADPFRPSLGFKSQGRMRFGPATIGAGIGITGLVRLYQEGTEAKGFELGDVLYFDVEDGRAHNEWYRSHAELSGPRTPSETSGSLNLAPADAEAGVG